MRNRVIRAAVRGGSTSSTRVWIPIGAGFSLFALAGSAVIIPQLRLLHFLQALIYVAVMILARRDSPWGFGAGFTIAVIWNGFSIFVTRFMQAGAEHFGLFFVLVRRAT
jgi:hypothetical protein